MNNHGQALVLSAMLLTAMIAVIGVCIDTGLFFLQRAELQTIADVAALGGIHKYEQGSSAVQEQAEQIVVDNWKWLETPIITVEYPYASSEIKTRVIVSKPLSLVFFQHLFSADRLVHASAVATLYYDTSEWRHFHNDSANSGLNSDANFHPPLIKKWEFSTGSNNPRASVTIVNNVVYCVAGNYLYAINGGTGLEIWKYNIGTSQGCQPTFANGYIYVATDWGVDTVYCFNTSGGLVWSTHLRGISTTSSLAVDSSQVYQSCSSDGGLYIYNALTGQPIKPAVSLPLPGGNPSYLNTGLAGAGGTGGFGTPALWSSYVYLTSGNGNIICYNTTTYAEVWCATSLSGGGIMDSPVVDNGSLYLGGQTKLYCLNALTGIELWSKGIGARSASPCISNTRLYLNTHNKLVCLDATGGSNLWSNTHVQYSTPAITEDYIYTVSDTRNTGLQAVDLNTGASLWDSGETLIMYYRDCGPSIGYGMVIVPDDGSNKIIAYTDPREGRARLVE